MTVAGRKPKQKIDWSALRHRILSAIDIGALAESWGVQFSSDTANPSGWRECHAIDREDANPSAAICVESENGELGMYSDFGGGEKAINLFELGARLGRYADWEECRADLARIAGVELPAKKADPGKDLKIDRWFPALAPHFTSKKPGTTEQGLIDCGAVHAMHYGRRVIAFPIIGLETSDPVGWVLVGLSAGESVPKYNPKTKEVTYVKSKLTYGSTEAGLLGRYGVERLKVPGLAELVWKVEGISDMIALQGLIPEHLKERHLVVTNPKGSKETPKWQTSLLATVNCNVLHDADEPGQVGAIKWANDIAAQAGEGIEVRNVQLPYAIEKTRGKDLRDLIADGTTYEGLLELAASTRPVDAKEATAERVDCISNGVEVEVDTPDGTITKVEPLKMPDIIDLVDRVTGGVLNRLIGGDLFVNDSHGLCWFPKPDALFGWLAQFKQVKWFTKPGFVSKGEFFHELQRIAKAFSAIESLPHEPKLPDHFYACPEFEPGDGAALNQLVSFFRPETTVDRELIKALFVTPCWGGRPGSLPAWSITSDQGRGAGKTKLAEGQAYLWGGFIDVSANEDIETLKSRFLSSGAMGRRIAMLDNVKAGVFSSATLEALITTPTISGKRLYHGEATRPNTITWVMTINGLSLSTDLAQRCIIVKLVRGENRATWFEDVIAFIDANRQRLLADCIGFLRSPPTAELPRYSRWAAWEGAILSRLDNPADVQRLILERQAACDADSDEMGLVEDFFADQLQKLGYRPDSESIRIPVAVVARWFNWATGDRTRTAGVTRRLKQAADEGQLQRLSVDSTRTYGRCFIWEGPYCDVNERTQNDLASRIGQAAQSKDGKDAW